MIKRFFAPCLLFSLIMLVSCNSDSGVSEVGEEMEGVQIPYDDTPGIVKTELRNKADGLDGIGYYFNGRKSGSWIEYDQNNMLKNVTTYIDGKKEGIVVEINNNQLTRHFQVHNGQRHGEYVEYTGVRVKEMRNYQNGKQHGVTRIYYDTGVLMEESNYVNGLRDGVCKWFDQNGNVSLQYEYKNGELVKQ